MNNTKVPFAVLSCFLIAFVIQGILKLCGIFVFDKTLSWEIFKIIDDTMWLNILFNTLINIIAIYCLSFALTTRPYSNKWYHYVIICLSSLGVIVFKLLTYPDIKIQILLDVYLYVVVPMIINLTTSSEYKVLPSKSFVMTLTIQILLYFCYLGLVYWSGLLNSFIPVELNYVTSVSIFLIHFEAYIGLVAMLLSFNILLTKIKKGDISMFFPQNISSEEARAKELARVKAKKDAKLAKKSND